MNLELRQQVQTELERYDLFKYPTLNRLKDNKMKVLVIQ